MFKKKIISALDLGSDQIKLAVAHNEGEGGSAEILDIICENSAGIRKGVVVNPDKAAEKINKVLERAEITVGRKVKEVTVNISGSHLFVSASKGVVAVSRADALISPEDIDRVLLAAQAFSLPSNKEVLEALPKHFTVDGEGKIKDPLGMKGIRLEAEILAICCFSPYLKNLTNALSLADLEILDIVPSALASASSVLNARQKELGVAVVDIGAWTTNMAVFEEGDLVHMAALPLGSGHITNDIAIGLQIDIDMAEKIKIKFGGCLYERKGKPEKIELPIEEIFESEPPASDFETILGEDRAVRISAKSRSKEKKKGNMLVFSRKFLIDVVEARTSEIFTEVQKELKKIGKNKMLPAGIVLTGGGAKLTDIDDLVKKELKLPCHIGVPKGIAGLSKDPALSTLCGLLLRAIELEESEKGMAKSALFGKFKKLFRIFIP